MVALISQLCTLCRLAEVPNNFYRLLRILEVVQTTGGTMAALDIDEAAPLDFDFRCFFLHRPRIDLYRRIDLRCEQMVARGLLQVKPPPVGMQSIRPPAGSGAQVQKKGGTCRAFC